MRLRGFDYSRPGEYFITIVTAHRRRILGRVVGGRMQLSEIGRIVENCWKEIPAHFPGTCVEVFQIMPDHVHGIVEIREPSRRGVQLNIPTGDHFSRISPRKGTLGVIVRTFKAAVTTELKRVDKWSEDPFWQRGYHDHIIRDHIDRFFIEQYIELNPIVWELDANNHEGAGLSIEDLEKMLREQRVLLALRFKG
jgi:REP-associated tyrosine transposase